MSAPDQRPDLDPALDTPFELGTDITLMEEYISFGEFVLGRHPGTDFVLSRTVELRVPET